MQHTTRLIPTLIALGETHETLNREPPSSSSILSSTKKTKQVARQSLKPHNNPPPRTDGSSVRYTFHRHKQ